MDVVRKFGACNHAVFLGVLLGVDGGRGMAAVLRWLVAVVASVAAFFAVAVPWAVLSSGGGDPWEVIGPVAGVVAAGVLAGVGWWASQTGAPGGTGPVRTVRQSAHTKGNVRQTAGSIGASGRAGRRPMRESIRQKGRGGGDVDQVGGDRT
ncbi:hypothetical protein ACFQ6S_04915 [Streptomyces sp. NPDC056479]|uniref:hypothetical protein n=1 Tax=Streptomyces sp. NPDC056479 TaxID=3345832 RepID=UPI0036BDB5D5